MKIAVANRLQGTQEYYFSKKLREVEAMNQSGPPVINLGIGSPDLMPPAASIAKLCASADEEKNHGYQSYKGIPALRQAFAAFYAKYYNVSLDPGKEIMPLIGSKEGIVHISMTYINEGDEVLVPNPGYPAYAAGTKMAGGTTILYDLEEENGWLPNLEKLAQQNLEKVKIMWVNFPNMPTGANGSFSFFEKLIAFGRENNILICNDNPYSFILNDRPQSLLAVPGALDTALELNSLSKSHNMAGWRMGMLAADESHIQNILRFKSNMDSGMFLPIQLAAAEALQSNESWFSALNDTYRERRAYVWKLLDTLDCTYDTTQTGLFVWAKAPGYVASVSDFVDDILYKGRVFITPGFIFGSNGERFVRISLCNNTTVLEEALQRVQALKQVAQ